MAAALQRRARRLLVEGVELIDQILDLRLHHRPGDIVGCDDDGVVAVPFAHTAAVLKATEAKQAAEQKQIAEIKAGTSDRAWIDAALKRLGCEGV